MNVVSSDMEAEDTQHARNKRGASLEAEEMLPEENANEFNGVEDQTNGAGAELEHNEEEVEKLTDEHEDEGHHGDKSDIESHHSQHEEHEHFNVERSSPAAETHGYDHVVEEVYPGDYSSPRHEQLESFEEHHRESSPASQHENESSHQTGNREDDTSPNHEATHHLVEGAPESNHNTANEQENDNNIARGDRLEDDITAEEHDNNNESELDQHERQSNYAESHGGQSVDAKSNEMVQSIYQQHDTYEVEDTNITHQHDADQAPPGSPKELLNPESPIQKAQDVMVNSFYPGAEHDEPPRLPSPDPNESVEERSHEEHVERDPIQAHEHAFEPGFISSSTHTVEEHHHEEEPHHYNGVNEDENLEPPLSNRSLESFQQHEQDVADDIQHDYDIQHEHDSTSQHSQEVYNDENREPENYTVASPHRNTLLPQPSIEITAPSDFGDTQVDEISAPPTPNSPQTTTQTHSYDHYQVIDHPVHQREVDISDEEANENSSLIANGHEGDREDQDDEDDDDDTGSVVMHKTPDSANYQQHQHHQYQRSDDEQSETGQGHL
uniref:Uncharacterized protein n=1 Tax=Panagrolaimus davidi TaxID=227884 RepID=A0A914P7X8_9BILA